jgi:hypothetical protein
LSLDVGRALFGFDDDASGLLPGVPDGLFALRLKRRIGRLLGGRARGCLDYVDYPVSLPERNDCEIEVEDVLALFACFHEQIAEPFRRNRLEKNIIVATLDNEAAPAAARIVQVATNYLSDRLLKSYTRGDSLSGLYQTYLVAIQRNGRDWRLRPHGERRDKK